MIEPAGVECIVPVFYFALLCGENVPDGQAFAVGIVCAFYLEGSRGNTPFERLSKGGSVHRGFRQQAFRHQIRSSGLMDERRFHCFEKKPFFKEDEVFQHDLFHCISFMQSNTDDMNRILPED
jgi:hypothetical protein